MLPRELGLVGDVEQLGSIRDLVEASVAQVIDSISIVCVRGDDHSAVVMR
jgi:hypothetical protein